MSNLEQRMKELDDLRPPDLWESIQVRSGQPQTFIQRILNYFRLVSAMQVAVLALALAVIIGTGVVVSNLGVQEVSTANDPGDTVNEDEHIDEPKGDQTKNEDSVGSDSRPAGSSAGARLSSKGPRPGQSLGAGTLTADALDIVAFTRDTNIHRIGGDGSNDRSLAQGVAPSWSPDGKHIAFGTHYGGGRLKVMSSDGSDMREVENPCVPSSCPDAGGAFPEWSPDGQMLVFNWPCNASRGSWVADPTCWEYEPTPVVGCGSDCGIGVIDADGSGRRRLGTGLWPDWGPDGRIVFTDGIPSEQCEYGTSYDSSSPSSSPSCALPLWVMNADGTGRTALPIDKATGPKWSPDGKKIAYYVETEGVFISNANGTGRVKVAPAGYMHPAWSPDGQRLILTRKTENAWNVFVRAVDGSGEIQLTFGNRDTLPSFSPRR